MLWLGHASPASAETVPDRDPVILLQPAAASAAVQRSLARIRDELAADRFRVVVAESQPGADPAAAIDTAARGEAGGTVLVVFGDPATGQAELCLVRRAAGRVAVRRATVIADDPERVPEALASRALELLRATALELSIEGERPVRVQAQPEPRSPVDVRARVVPAPPAPVRVTVDMGVGMWNSLDGPPAAVTPVGRVGLRLWDWAWARISVAGLGSHPRVATSTGSAVLSQTTVLLEGAALLRRDKRIRPVFSLGAGILNVAVVGTGTPPYQGREPQQWSAAFDAGVGVAVAVGARAALVTELHALLATPHPVVRFADTRAATIGYPSLMLTLALQVAP
jgi:hypothetical protein